MARIFCHYLTVHTIDLLAAYRRRLEQERINAWKRVNRDKVNAVQRAYRAADPERAREYGREAYARDPGKHKAKNEDWAQRNPEKKRKLRRESAARNPEKTLARVKTWRKANPAKVKAYKAQYRARQRSRDRVVEYFTRDEIAERDNWTCHLCGGDVTREDWSLDHLIPISKGGDHTRLNVKIAHMLCNARRGNRDLPLVAEAA